MSTKNATFKMSLDRKYFISSWVAFFALVFIFAAMGLVIGSFNQIPTSICVIYVCFSIALNLVFPALYFAAPRTIEIKDGKINVYRLFRSAVMASVPLANITALKKIDLTRVWRKAGVGGFYGAWGLMTSKEISSFQGYLTKAAGYVIIERKDELPIVLTPDDPDRLISELQKWVLK